MHKPPPKHVDQGACPHELNVNQRSLRAKTPITGIKYPLALYIKVALYVSDMQVSSDVP